MRAGRTVGSSGGLVVVGHEVDGLHVDVGEHLAGDAHHAALGVTHGRGRIAVDGAEVALAVDQRIAQARRAAPGAPWCRRWRSRRGDGSTPMHWPTTLAHLVYFLLYCRPISLHACRGCGDGRA